MATNEKFRTENISFSADGLKLSGVLHLPADSRPPLVVGAHGLLSSASSPKQIALAHQCNHLGIAYFRFDHRGCGNSEGNFDLITSLEGRCKDLVAAVEAVNAELDTRGLGLFGSSMGGTVCLSAAEDLAADAVVTFAAPIRSDLKGSRLESFLMPPGAASILPGGLQPSAIFSYFMAMPTTWFRWTTPERFTAVQINPKS